MSQTLTPTEVARRVVAEAIWAPSVHNTQPWRFTVHDHQIGVHADPSRRLEIADPDGREMLISCGAAVFTARLALRSLGWIPEVDLLSDARDPMLVARLGWRRRAPVGDYEWRLFGHVRSRRTHRGAFDLEPLAPGLLAAMRTGAARDGAPLRVVADDGRRASLAAAIQLAERAAQLDGGRIHELARWAPPPGSPRADGVPPTAYPARPEHTSPDFPGRDFAHGRGWGLPPLTTASAARSTGVVALLTTRHDRPQDWVATGQALQRILLTASTCGAAVAMHSQPLELPWLRRVIRLQFSDGAYPHLILRFGNVTQVAASIRRDVADVLTLPADELPLSAHSAAVGRHQGWSTDFGVAPLSLCKNRDLRPWEEADRGHGMTNYDERS